MPKCLDSSVSIRLHGIQLQPLYASISSCVKQLLLHKPLGKMAFDNTRGEVLSMGPDMDSLINGSDYYNYQQAEK